MTQGGAGLNILSNTVELGGSCLSAFNDLEVMPLTPLIQLDFISGLNVQTSTTTISGVAAGTAGSVTANASRLRMSCGTKSDGSIVFQSRKPAKYRPGQGITARFTAAFDLGFSNNYQIVGMGNDVDGYFFGYNGTSFGILHRNNSVDTWTPQANWNQDACAGAGASGFTWDTTKGNVMMIKYSYLGYGNIKFFVQNQATGAWILCHVIKYTNSTQTIQLTNPSIPFWAQTKNTGNVTDTIMYVGSVGIFLSGVRSYTGNPRWATTNNKAATTTETNIFTLKNCTTYNGFVNRGIIRLNLLTFSSSANTGIATLRMRVNATLNGSPSFTTINGTTADNGATITSGNSVISYDVAGTTIATGGLVVFNAVTDNPNTIVENITDLDIFLAPGETMTFSVESTNSTTAAIAMNWTEDI